MTRRSSFVAAIAIVVGLAAGTASVHAWETANRLSYLTFTGPVALPGVTLDAGTYAFELSDPSSTNIVLVRNRARTKLFYLGMTLPIPRPASAGYRTSVQFGEAPRGEARPIVAWYPPDTAHGLQFIYTR